MTTQKTRRKKGRAQFGYTRQLPSGRWQASYVDKAGLIPELRGSEQRRQPFLLLQLPALVARLTALCARRPRSAVPNPVSDFAAANSHRG